MFRCLTCKETADKCSLCREQYVLKGTTCVLCPEGCKTCDIESDQSICRSCLGNYYLDGEKCIQFNSPYSTCFDEDDCYICETGYYINKIYTYPIPYRAECESCSERVPHCLECSTDCVDDDLDSYHPCGNFKCTECEYGYYLSSDSQSCLECPENCSICNNSTWCESCKTGFLLNSETGTCEKSTCPSKFLECNSFGCTACEDGYFLYWDNDFVSNVC